MWGCEVASTCPSGTPDRSAGQLGDVRRLVASAGNRDIHAFAPAPRLKVPQAPRAPRDMILGDVTCAREPIGNYTESCESRRARHKKRDAYRPLLPSQDSVRVVPLGAPGLRVGGGGRGAVTTVT
jgi:hypothetical protein